MKRKEEEEEEDREERMAHLSCIQVLSNGITVQFSGIDHPFPQAGKFMFNFHAFASRNIKVASMS